MKTEQLIRTLAMDHTAPRPDLAHRLLAGVLGAAAVSFVLLMLTLGLRGNLAAAVAEPRFLLKFPLTLGLAAAAAGLFLRLARPGAEPGGWPLALLAAPLLLCAAVVVELVVMPPATWRPRLIGHNSLVCLTFIPLLALPVLAALFAVLRQGAPTRPVLAGTVAGLLAGGAGAALYALHCVDDSPLFVATWYTLAIGALALLGAALGARVLRW